MRLISVAAAAGVLALFAVLGMVRVLEAVLRPLAPSPIAVSQPSLDFGRVPLNGREAREIVVRNDGAGPVHARFVVWGNACRVDPAELILHPGVEWAITVEARPDRPGPIEDVLTIQVLDGSVAPVAIPLAGVAGEVAPARELGEEVNRV
jgi:hypothetical protein